MAIELIGFGDDEKKRAEATLALATSSIGRAYAALVGAHKCTTQVSLNAFLSRTAKFKKAFTTWFGTPTPADVTTVKDNVSAMNTVITKGAIRIRYNANPVPVGHPAHGTAPCAALTNAVAYWWAANPAGGLQLQRATYQEAVTVQFYMALCQQFLANAALAGSTNPVRNQSKNVTLIHEVSHLAAGTDDHNVLMGGVATVANTKAPALELARTNTALAVDNAENYGYFCDEYHSDE